MLIEYAVISVLLYIAFASQITPNTNTTHVTVTQDAYNKANLSWKEYLNQVVAFSDIFQGIELNGKYNDSSSGAVTSPLFKA